MSIWKKLIRAYILVSLVIAAFLVIKFSPILRGELPPEVTTIMNDLPQLESILDKSPIRTPAALMGLAMLYQRKERLDDAERVYKKALALDPNLPQAHNSLGIIYDALDRRAEAFQEYTKALELEPNNPVLRENFRLAKEEHDRREIENSILHTAGQAPTHIQVVVPASEMRIDVTAPIEGQPYFLRSPQRVLLKNGRSITGDVVDKTEEGLWLETGRGMRLYLSRSEVERIEDARQEALPDAVRWGDIR
jgi:tetratricopeptide (TPR) repeat protein